MYLIDNAADSEKETGLKDSVSKCVEAFEAAMNDDINTAGAIAALFDMVKAINVKTGEGNIGKEELSFAYDKLCKLASVLGILSKKKENDLDSEVEELILQRTQARKEKNFVLADEIRAKLERMDIVLEDTREGVKWHRK